MNRLLARKAKGHEVVVYNFISSQMKKVAIVGIQGVPAKYGGFETLVENIIGENCPRDVEYIVFCSAKDYTTQKETYKGARLKYIPLFHANGMQSTPYDILSMMKCIRGYDVVVVLGVSGCLFLPIFRLFFRKRLIVNIDGLEHRRAKWGGFSRWFLKISEAMAVRYADVVVADNKGIQDYVTETYQKPSALIAYGYNHVKREIEPERQQEILEKYGVTSNSYAISVCRIEPENNSHIICEAFAKTGKNLVFVGNWTRSEYSRELMEKYKSYPNFKLIDSLYDLDELYVLRSNCAQYIHGHSAGGTNPSLVEAMYFGKPILAYDVIYNRETMKQEGSYFSNVETLATLLQRPDLNGTVLKDIVEKEYSWSRISRQYRELY